MVEVSELWWWVWSVGGVEGVVKVFVGVDRRWSHNRIRRSGECRKVGDSIWRACCRGLGTSRWSCPMGSQKKSESSEERARLETMRVCAGPGGSEVQGGDQIAWGEGWESDLPQAGQDAFRETDPERRVGTALGVGGMLRRVCLPSLTQRKGMLLHGRSCDPNTIEKL